MHESEPLAAGNGIFSLAPALSSIVTYLIFPKLRGWQRVSGQRPHELDLGSRQRQLAHVGPVERQHCAVVHSQLGPEDREHSVAVSATKAHCSSSLGRGCYEIQKERGRLVLGT